MLTCPANILASAQAAATNSYYGYTQIPTSKYSPYTGEGVPGPRDFAHYVLGDDQTFTYLDTRDMYDDPSEYVAEAGTIVTVLDYYGFWRVTGFRTPDGQTFHLTET